METTESPTPDHPRTEPFSRLSRPIQPSRVRDRIAELMRPTGEEDLMAVAYPQPRFSLSKAAALAGASIAVVVCLVWFLTSSGAKQGDNGHELAALAQRSEAESSTATNPESLGASSGDGAAGGAGDGAAGNAKTKPGDATAPTEAAGEIVVSVVGLVENPGVMTLPEGSRAADALAIARVLPEADLLRINQAERLSDGQQLVVLGPDDPAPPDTSSANAAGNSGGGAHGSGHSGGSKGPISLNSATAAELMSLHGVGEATAAAIIEFRESNGGFSSVDQLLDVSGIGPAKFSRLQDEVTV